MESRPSKLRMLLGIDVRGLAAFRIGLGLVLLTDLAHRLPDLRAHYTDAGVLTRGVLTTNTNPWAVSLYLANGNTVFVATLFLFAALFALMLLVGYRTRLATVASWVMLMSLHYRNPLIGNAGDLVLRLMLFWGMFLPLGACASLDRRLCRIADEVPRIVFSAATVAALLQLVFVYVFSVFLKSHHAWHVDGSAIYYALNLDLMARTTGRLLLTHPTLMEWMTRVTYWVEGVGPLLAFVPFGIRYFRLLVVLLFIGFHVGLALTFQLILFPYVCMVCWLLFLPPWFWDGVGSSTSGRRVAAWGSTVTGRLEQAVRSASGRCPWLVAGISPPRTPRWAGVLAGVLLAYVLILNVDSVVEEFPFPESQRWASLLLGLDQRWEMFAPDPRKDDGWWVVPARLADGSEVDLFRGRSPIVWDKPDSPSGEFRSHRWRKYLMLLWAERHRVLVVPYAHWLRQRWEAEHGPQRAVIAMEIYYMMEYTEPPGHPPLTMPLLVYQSREPGQERLVPFKTNEEEFQARYASHGVLGSRR